jgi:hypothetical protein
METKEARELLKENFDEITGNEYDELSHDYVLIECSGEFLYFKPKEKFLKVFKNNEITIWVYSTGNVEIDLKIENRHLSKESLELLDQAIKLSQEIRGVK